MSSVACIVTAPVEARYLGSSVSAARCMPKSRCNTSGLQDVQLVISDAHQGLKAAIAGVLQGASWQRCRVRFVRNALSLVPQGAQQTVAATICTVFVQPDAATARE